MIGQSLPQASLWFVSGPLAQQTFPLTAQETWIGSSPGNHICISDQSLQPWHVRLSWDSNGLIIQSYQDSLVTVNQQLIPGAAYLQYEDEVMLGQNGISFRILNPALSPQSSAPPAIAGTIPAIAGAIPAIAGTSYAAIQYSGQQAALPQSALHATVVQSGAKVSAASQSVQGEPRTGSHVAPQQSASSSPIQSPERSQPDAETVTLQGGIFATIQQEFEMSSSQKAFPQKDAAATPAKGLPVVSSHNEAAAPPSTSLKVVSSPHDVVSTPSKGLAAVSAQGAVSTPSQSFEIVSPTPQKGLKAASQQSGVHSTSLRDFRTTPQLDDGNTIPQLAVKVQPQPVAPQSNAVAAFPVQPQPVAPQSNAPIPRIGGQGEPRIGALDLPPEARARQGELKMAAAFPLPPVHTEITRYLCAAAHFDEQFRDYVLKHIASEEHKSLGEAHDVDFIPVVKWSLAAQKRAFIRNAILCAILLGMLLFWVISFVLWLRSSSMNLYALPGFSSGSTFLVNTAYMFFSSANPGMQIALILLLQFLLVTVLVAAVHFARPSLRRGTLYLIAYLLLFPLLFLPFYALAWIAVVVEKAITYYGAAAASLTREKFRADFPQVPLDAVLERRLRESAMQDANVVVYSGGSPFAGSGSRSGGGSYAVDISKAKTGTTLSAETFQISEIYDYVADMLKGLKLYDQSEIRLLEKLYINGQEIRTDRRFLETPFARPYTQVSSMLLKEIMEQPTQNRRYYRCVRVALEREDVIVSLFFRCVLSGKTLFIEIDNLALPSLKEHYYQVDALEPTPTVGKIWELMQQSFTATFPLLLHAPVQVISWLLKDWLTQQRRERVMRTIKENAAFDYGAARSLREIASADSYHRGFQQLDQAMYARIIEDELLKSIAKFLDSKHIDTTVLYEDKISMQ